MKFIIDVGVGKKVDEYLKSTDYNIKYVRDIDIHLSDEEILEKAFAEKRMIITMDKDFGELIYHLNIKHCGVLLLRLEGANSTEKITVITKIFNLYMDKLESNFCVYQNNKLRIRK